MVVEKRRRAAGVTFVVGNVQLVKKDQIEEKKSRRKARELDSKNYTPLHKRNSIKNKLNHLESDKDNEEGKSNTNENLEGERHKADSKNNSLENIQEIHPRIN